MKMFKEQKDKELYRIIVLSGITIVLFYFMMLRFDAVVEVFNTVNYILLPFILGIIFAFLLRGPMRFIELHLLKGIKNQKSKHSLAVLLAILFGILCIIIFFALVIPQVVQNIMTIGLNLKDYIANVDSYIAYLESLVGGPSSDIIENILNALPSVNELMTTLFDSLKSIIPNALNTTINVANTFIKFLVGIIVCIYILNDDHKISATISKLSNALFDKEKAENIMEIVKMTDRTFTNFISGKIIDSIIIGLICYICMTILKLPYALLISVIVGITNVIPFFGPFIGAIPSAFIVLMVSPIQALWFLIFILVLQQFDGNILGPYILGDSVGLPPIWVMFAILVGGGLFGIAGMIVGVPTFAVIYELINRKIEKVLKEKNQAKVIE